MAAEHGVSLQVVNLLFFEATAFGSSAKEAGKKRGPSTFYDNMIIYMI